MYRKIRLYYNGFYVCSSNKYKRCKDFLEAFISDNNNYLVQKGYYHNGVYIKLAKHQQQVKLIRCSFK